MTDTKPPFVGAAKPLTDADVNAAAASLGVEPAHIRAICDVETGPQGAFDWAGRPTILYERHYFHRLTGGRFSGAHPDLSNPVSGGYGKFSAQYPKLLRAIELDRAAALASASWGRFQVMGENWKICGFPSLEHFVAAMMESEAAHLAACVAFIRSRRLDGALRLGDWAAFARGYNGPGYVKNQYDTKLAAAFAKHERML